MSETQNTSAFVNAPKVWAERPNVSGSSLFGRLDRAKSSAVPNSVHRTLLSEGRPLDRDTRQFMEGRFHHDFSQVRLHTGSVAAQSARAIDAQAYAVGQHVVVGDQVDLNDQSHVLPLLAHELAHVVQQSGNPRGSSDTLTLQHSNHASEHQAELAAGQILQGQPVSLSAAPVSIQRIRCGAILIADEQRIPGVIGTEYERQIRLEAIVQLGAERIIGRLEIPDASAQAHRGEECGTAKESKSFGLPDIIYKRGNGIIELAEVKIATGPCVGLAEMQMAKYIEKGNAPEHAGWRQAQGIKRVDRMPMSRIHFPPAFEYAGQTILVDWCNDGVIVYKPIKEKKEEEKAPRRHTSLAEVALAPGLEIGEGFARGFLSGAQSTVSKEALSQLREKLRPGKAIAAFHAGEFVGRPIGAAESIGSLLVGVYDIATLALKMGPAGIIAGETEALLRGKKSPTAERARLAADIIKGTELFLAELTKNPNLLFDVSQKFGQVCGEEAGRRFIKDFASATPVKMGFIAGRIEGYLAVEILMLLIGAEEFIAAGKAISAAAKSLEASSFAMKIFRILQKIPELKRIMMALKGAEKFAEAEKTAKAFEAVDDAEKALRVRVAVKNSDAAGAAKAIDEAAIDAEALKEANEEAQLARRMTK